MNITTITIFEWCIIIPALYVIPGFTCYKHDKSKFKKNEYHDPTPWAWFIPVVNFIWMLGVVVEIVAEWKIFSAEFWTDRWKSNTKKDV